MMHTGHWEGNPAGYTTVEMLLDDVFKQMASSHITRSVRNSTTHRAGGSMRIVKPNSASSSPRGSAGLGRRRTVMSDGAYRQRLAFLEQQNDMARGSIVSSDDLAAPRPRSRPVSWHPASYPATQQQYQPTCHAPSIDLCQPHTIDHSVNSGYASPDSTFSPVPMPFNGREHAQRTHQELTYACQPSASGYSATPLRHDHQFQVQTQQTPAPQGLGNMDPTMFSHFDWHSFATDDFDNSSTAPPTPESFLPRQHPESTFPTTDEIPYHPLSLSEPESDGEVLVGMGLYDAPEATKTPSTNSDFEYYRGLMMSGYLGTGSRKAAATGKGLKLEEKYVPPPSDDDEEEQDGEGEEDDEAPMPSLVAPPSQGIYLSSQPPMTVPSPAHGSSSWL
ncbi:hypothetical protein QTJ16_000065 [Diplocarpon rosae]|uniref:Uncharacterized protein n=1 Tax=Diplocarpon rosae TaxID=946125 RepID=A0AAD9T4M6_9HELO|nr:hypothetical protein QTJ16_000065 [Diplocarpon rosae]